jgi:hypothetical protein
MNCYKYFKMFLFVYPSSHFYCTIIFKINKEGGMPMGVACHDGSDVKYWYIFSERYVYESKKNVKIHFFYFYLQ